jgi:hypothetical protein
LDVLQEFLEFIRVPGSKADFEGQKVFGKIRDVRLIIPNPTFLILRIEGFAMPTLRLECGE